MFEDDEANLVSELRIDKQALESLESDLDRLRRFMFTSSAQQPVNTYVAHFTPNLAYQAVPGAANPLDWTTMTTSLDDLQMIRHLELLKAAFDWNTLYSAFPSVSVQTEMASTDAPPSSRDDDFDWNLGRYKTKGD